MDASLNEERKAFLVPHLRWWICTVLFASTAINYIHRQTLVVLGPYLKVQFHWSNSDFALLLIAFRIAYALGQAVSGKFLDRLGTRLGLLISVAFYSLAAMSSGLATGLRGFVALRFLVGAGESANWPGATKAVSEWFPKSERGWAVAIFDSGSAVGGAIAPVLVLWLYHAFGAWQPVFFITGCLGLVWVLVWYFLYHPPASHPRLDAPEREMLLKSRERETMSEAHADLGYGRRENVSWVDLLQLPHTWGITLSRAITDPVWFFIMDWFAIYLVSKGFRLEDTLLGLLSPYVAGNLGNLFGGGLSSELIRRGWPVLRARKLVIVLGATGMLLLIPAIYTSNLTLIVAFFSIASFSYAAWATMLLTLPADLYPSDWVASVSGISLTGGSAGTVLSTIMIGGILDRYAFKPVVIAAGLAPMIGVAFILLLVRPPRRAAKR